MLLIGEVRPPHPGPLPHGEAGAYYGSIMGEREQSGGLVVLRSGNSYTAYSAREK